MSPNDKNAVHWVEDVDVAAALIYFTYRSVQRHLAKELSSYHISWGHFAIMMALYENEGVSQEHLARSRGFDKTMIAKSLLTLEKEGLVYRKNDRQDRRVKRLFLTEKGKEIKPRLDSIGAELNASLIGEMGDKKADVAMDCIRKIAINAARLT
jgi:DNA-binding MarR family transcriptional regulator